MMNLRDRETLYSTKGEASSSSSRKWLSALKNPRIVRASRTFGGKDRHSKVTTIKGLRDRRIRLSVPTAIQLYDLQEKLGLNQPSKVIDWLLDVTKDDIDDLPPLPAMPVCFSPYQQSIHGTQGYSPYRMSLSSLDPFFESHLIPSKKGGININSSLSVGFNDEDPSIEEKLKYWDPKHQKIRVDKGVIRDAIETGNSQVFAQNLFPTASGNASSSSLLNNHNPMFNYYHDWEPSSLSLTHMGSHGLLSSHNDHQQGNRSSNSSLFLSPSMANNSSLFSQHTSLNHLQVENDIRHLNRFHLSNNPFLLSMNHEPHLHQNHDQRQDKYEDNPWKLSSI